METGSVVVFTAVVAAGNVATPSSTPLTNSEALKNPNGYVYVVDEKYKGDTDVPPKAILGAWKVNEQGIIVGDFLPNPNYKTKLN